MYGNCKNAAKALVLSMPGRGEYGNCKDTA